MLGAGTVQARYSALEHGAGESWFGMGCITSDPCFVNSALGNCRLLEGSPCINTGTNLAWMMGATDLDGNPRIHDGRVDMGCYEFIPEPSLWAILGLGSSIVWRARESRR